MRTVTQPIAESTPPPSTRKPRPSRRREKNRDELAAAHAAAKVSPAPVDAPLASTLLRGLGAELFETDMDSAGLPVIAETMSTLRVLVEAVQLGGMSDEASNAWDEAMAAVQARLYAGFTLVHAELRGRSDDGDALEDDETPDDAREATTAAAPPSTDGPTLGESLQEAVCMLDGAREAVDTLHAAIRDVDVILPDAGGTTAAYLTVLEALRNVRTKCLYWGGK